MSDDEDLPWVDMDAIEREALEPDRRAEFRAAMLNRIDQPAIEGRVLGPGERTPFQKPSKPAPEPQRFTPIRYTGPLEGRILASNTYTAFCLDGPSKGEWVTARNHWRIHERTAVSQHWYDAASYSGIADEALTIKVVMYHLETFALLGSAERRRYGFWTINDGHEIDPGVALFVLIDSDAIRTQQCRLG